MKLEIVKYVSVNKASFVAFWSKEYSYDLEHLYDENIGKSLDKDRVWALYKWKNSTEEIAKKKQQSIQTIYLPQLKNLPRLSSHEAGKKYLASLQGGAIWGIFWLHCINHRLFPIFDQHTYRAMAKICNFSLSELPDSRPQKIQIYFDHYIPFTKTFKKVSHRDLDKALFAYGRFLKRGLSGK